VSNYKASSLCCARVGANDRLKSALKHDGVFRDRTNPENEFDLLECSPLQSASEYSSKWLGDLRKMRRPLRDMLNRLFAQVNYKCRQVDELRMFGFNVSALALRVSRMTRCHGYVCLLNAYDPLLLEHGVDPGVAGVCGEKVSLLPKLMRFAPVLSITPAIANRNQV
jgi:hypothetical protein